MRSNSLLGFMCFWDTKGMRANWKFVLLQVSCLVAISIFWPKAIAKVWQWPVMSVVIFSFLLWANLRHKRMLSEKARDEI